MAKGPMFNTAEFGRLCDEVSYDALTHDEAARTMALVFKEEEDEYIRAALNEMAKALAIAMFWDDMYFCTYKEESEVTGEKFVHLRIRTTISRDVAEDVVRTVVDEDNVQVEFEEEKDGTLNIHFIG